MKAPLFKALFTTVFLISLYSCSSSDDGTGDKKYPVSSSSAIGGSYNMTSMTTDIEVDLNNDGILSMNLLTETDPDFFDSQIPELEIKPTIVNNTLVPLMSFYLPQPNVTVTTPNKPGSVKYSRSGLGYKYEFNNSTQTITIDKSHESPDVSAYGRIENIQIAGKGILKASFSKYYYDFAVAKWRLLNIVCLYQKM